MSRTTFSEQLAASRQMMTAINANLAALTGYNAGATFVTEGENLLTQLEAADVNQERLKAELKLATTQVESLQAQLANWQSYASNAVKLAYHAQPEKWIEFGIKAKR
jgi:hypothetical protein